MCVLLFYTLILYTQKLALNEKNELNLNLFA